MAFWCVNSVSLLSISPLNRGNCALMKFFIVCPFKSFERIQLKHEYNKIHLTYRSYLIAVKVPEALWLFQKTLPFTHLTYVNASSALLLIDMLVNNAIRALVDVQYSCRVVSCAIGMCLVFLLIISRRIHWLGMRYRLNSRKLESFNLGFITSLFLLILRRFNNCGETKGIG